MHFSFIYKELLFPFRVILSEPKEKGKRNFHLNAGFNRWSPDYHRESLGSGPREGPAAHVILPLNMEILKVICIVISGKSFQTNKFAI